LENLLGMPWRQQGGGGGPWGGGSGGGGSGGGGGPWGRGTGGPTPPDFEDLFRKGQDRFRRMMPGGFGSGVGVLAIVVIIVLLWGLSGIYRVQPDEKGVVLRFGAWVRTENPGLRYHLPSPIESVIKPKVTRVNRIEVGLRTQAEGLRGPGVRDVPEESLMLTGDENIVDIDFSVFWFIREDPRDFLFNIHNPEQTVKVAAESVMREVIGKTRIQSALTEGRSEIERGVNTRLQSLLDGYHAGVQIQQVQLLKVDPPQPVIDAFIDVQRARADQERARNEAEAYSRDVVPRARGDSQRLIQEATAYREEVVNRAQGEAQRFLSIYEAYRLAKDVTMQRIYLETMEEVMRDMTKIIIDPGAQSSQGVLPYLPLPELRQRAPQAPRQGPQTSGPPVVQGQTPGPAQPQAQPQQRTR
jgi:modulator of FtsH protease HflK